MQEYSEKEIFQRTELLVGGDVLAAFRSAKVIIFGVGGVGSWCAEGLVRSGVRRLTIVDSDKVSPSNINRQLMATVAETQAAGHQPQRRDRSGGQGLRGADGG